jgi:hypothetical protein
MPKKNIRVKRRIFYCTLCDWVYCEDKENERTTEMTNAEMTRRIAEMHPRSVAIVERHARWTTYTPREVFNMRIPGTGKLANVNAVFQKVREEA